MKFPSCYEHIVSLAWTLCYFIAYDFPPTDNSTKWIQSWFSISEFIFYLLIAFTSPDVRNWRISDWIWAHSSKIHCDFAYNWFSMIKLNFGVLIELFEIQYKTWTAGLLNTMQMNLYCWLLKIRTYNLSFTITIRRCNIIIVFIRRWRDMIIYLF